MSTLAVKIEALASEISFSKFAVHIVLVDGREISAPLEWFPKLLKASQAHRDNWELIGQGECIHWPDIDEDIETESLLVH